MPEETKTEAKIKKNILWVEDDAFLGSILMKKFSVSGHNVRLAKNSDEAYKALEESKPDVIVLDIFLPGVNGFDILQKIKSDQSLKSIPVIMLSNTSKPSDFENARVLGAQKFLVKAAVSLDEIIREVEQLTK